jgi:hypothetical protein
MNDATPEQLALVVRLAGGLHFVTLALACATPIPVDWDANLQRLPETHRRFALAQNVFIGAVLAALGAVSCWLAPELAAVQPSSAARALCGLTAAWWGARLVVLPWLRVGPQLTTGWLRLGFICLCMQCAGLASFYGWLALR